MTVCRWTVFLFASQLVDPIDGRSYGLPLDGLTVCLSISAQLLNLLYFSDSSASKTASHFNAQHDYIHKLGLRTRRRLVVLNNYV